ncbi:hypothetical protein GEOBRER4_n3734 [Citrifermentans bremense]|uniref:Uncharacterized protein n=1 Tax=Citrifermentans bremense TaxID=60035 RepID=A0A6S6M594_9BACT|nr:hypothetical protein [Citrifermentans bremense]BCG48840.1 hypothetical protein GEOBRER4_n3734 [Citrifermentans bremense]
MEYGITKLVLGPMPFVNITEEEYCAIKNAKKYLFEAYYLEQKVDVVMEDFLEYEMTLLSTATKHMIFHDLNYPRMQNEVNVINRRIINLLSACRMYLDHYCHHLNNIYGERSQKVKEVQCQVKHEYDISLSYRVLEALRNYVQHRGFPVQSVTYNSKREEEAQDKWQIVFGVTPYLKVKELAEDKKFKRSVIQELESLGEKFDIKPMIRDYITSIGKIHTKAREVLKDDVLTWENTISKCVSRFKDATKSDDIVGLGIAMRDGEGLYPEMFQIFTDFIDHRQELEQKNSFIGSLTRFYVASKSIN